MGGRNKDPVVDEATREIGRQAERVSGIVERVRRYARGRGARHGAQDLCSIVKSAYASFSSGTEHSNVRVSAELPERAPVEGDPLELELLIVNLLKNALHAAKSTDLEKGEIRMRLTRDEHDPDAPRWVLAVEDNGRPLSEEKFAELSHPVTSEKLEGLGLGLSICRVIAERHAARLTFRRAKPQGLVVLFSIAEHEETPATHSSEEK